MRHLASGFMDITKGGWGVSGDQKVSNQGKESLNFVRVEKLESTP